MLIGVISDTHGLLRPEALVALAEAEHILHAGDVGDIAILDALQKIAPVTAIRGNVDVYGDVRQAAGDGDGGARRAVFLHGAFGA